MDTFIGFITAFPWAWAPRDWSTCQGQTIQVQQNTALFALLGTAFGGNGQTTFLLPELRGRQIIGDGQSQATGTVFNFAQKGGAETVVLNTSQTPVTPHTHTATFTPGASGSSNLSVSTAAPSAATPLLTNGQTAYLANSAAGGAGNALKGLYTTTAPTAGATATIPVNGGGGSGTVTVNPTTAPAAASVPLMNPYLALNFCIAINGLFPSRN